MYSNNTTLILKLGEEYYFHWTTFAVPKLSEVLFLNTVCITKYIVCKTIFLANLLRYL
jgi:hypothetical protein